MNEVIINPNEVESIWEKDNVCFVKMKTGKVWLCELTQDISENVKNVKTTAYIAYQIQKGNFLIKLSLSQKGKSENDG